MAAQAAKGDQPDRCAHVAYRSSAPLRLPAWLIGYTPVPRPQELFRAHGVAELRGRVDRFFAELMTKAV